MPRGEKATYESAFAGAKRFLSRRSADAREAHIGRFLAEVKAMGPAIKVSHKTKAGAVGGDGSPAPKKKVAAKAKAKKKSTKRATRRTADENTDGDGGGDEGGAEE